eukprot:scaffold32161_cov124-Isochrysis_galbana.AAC.2
MSALLGTSSIVTRSAWPFKPESCTPSGMESEGAVATMRNRPIGATGSARSAGACSARPGTRRATVTASISRELRTAWRPSMNRSRLVPRISQSSVECSNVRIGGPILL